MKKFRLILIVLFVQEISYGQTNYYKLRGQDSFITENNIRLILDSLLINVPTGYYLRPIIYNKLLKPDSVINYVYFAGEKLSDPRIYNNQVEFVYNQDSLYLLLDKKLPDFTLQDLTGKTFNSDELIGKPTLINFWAKYCKPCVAEIPQLNKLKQTYGDRFNFVAISESTCSGDDIRELLKKIPFEYYQLLNGDKYKNVLKITSLPCNIFVDKDGYIRDIRGGLSGEQDSISGELVFKSNTEFIKILNKLE